MYVVKMHLENRMLHPFIPVIKHCCKPVINNIIPLAPATVLSTRNIVVVKRQKEVRLHKKDVYNPKLRSAQFVYDVDTELTHKPMFTTIKVLMMGNADGVGIMGEVKEVDTKLFRNYLYPSGLATYPTWDKFEELEEIIQPIKQHLESLYKFSVESRMLIKKMIGCHLPVPLDTQVSELMKKHIKVAFRVQGVHVSEDCIILPSSPISEPGEFVFELILNNEITIAVRGTVYKMEKDEDGEIIVPELPPLWGNSPIITKETESLIKILLPEYLNRSATVNTDK